MFPKSLKQKLSKLTLYDLHHLSEAQILKDWSWHDVVKIPLYYQIEKRRHTDEPASLLFSEWCTFVTQRDSKNYVCRSPHFTGGQETTELSVCSHLQPS